MLADSITLIELGEAEGDEAVVAEAEAALILLQKTADRAELEALLSGEADGNDCWVEVHAGAGGTEAQDWAEMLLRMYTRWAERRRLKVEWIDDSAGDEAGIKSATIRGQRRRRLRLAEDRERRPPAGANLAVRLQRAAAHLLRLGRRLSRSIDDRSRSRSRTRTSASTPTARPAPAASTSTSPTPPCASRICRPASSSPCQNERSQHRNRAMAMKMLKARLYELELRKREEAAKAEHDAKSEIGWGHQIRSLRAAALPDDQGPAHRRRDLEHASGARRRPRRLHGRGARRPDSRQERTCQQDDRRGRGLIWTIGLSVRHWLRAAPASL